MLRSMKRDLAGRIRQRVVDLHGIQHEPVIESPPRRELGDFAFPVGMHLARELKKNPRAIAQELLDGLEWPEWVREVRVEGAGYLNVFLRRAAVAGRLLGGASDEEEATGGKVIVEHTNINPNKAAHIGHLRNAVLGDTIVRLLGARGHAVEVQNYIDDTGVQVADVVVGFLDVRGLQRSEIEAIPEPFDFVCWDVYSEVGRWYEEDPERKKLRTATLHELENGTGERAEVGRIVARRVLARHLATMRRLDIGYDLLTYESSILQLDFFATAFEKLEERGAVRLETEGKNQGCWVMPLSESEEFAGMEDPDKVIVRSDGTVTYVGKDIAYQLWKFGLLGRDFRYRRWEEEEVWEAAAGEPDPAAPSFGGGWKVINVIDARQSYLQKVVKAGLQALGHADEADRSIHFAYEMVSLSESTARAFGFLEDGEEAGALEMSGRKGIGVKADDLLDRLETRAREEIESRQRGIDGEELVRLSKDISVAALRFFMAKASTTRLIAFDMDEALSFEGESGPYLQYSLVRAANIRRRLEEAGLASGVAPSALLAADEDLWSDDLWDAVLAVGQIPEKIEAAADSLEVSVVARHALDLAQQFNALYHRHPILQEEDEALRTVRLATVAVFEIGLQRLCELLGVPVPERM